MAWLSKISHHRKFLKQGSDNKHNDEVYLKTGWQRYLPQSEFNMVRSALSFIEKQKQLKSGDTIYTTTEELRRWSGLSKPHDALRGLQKKGLIEYIPGKRGGRKDRKPTFIKRVIPVPEPPPPKEKTSFEQKGAKIAPGSIISRLSHPKAQ